MSSSHLFLGLPTALLDLHPRLRPGIHFAAANLHLIFLCVIVQHGILAVLIFSSVCLVLFLCIRSNLLQFQLFRMSSSMSHMKETSLSWSQSVFGLLLSSVSPSEFWWPSFACVFSSFVGSSSTFVFFPSLLFFTVFKKKSLCLNNQRRSILRCVDLIIFSCSFERVHVPETHVSEGVMTILNRRRLCRT